MTRTPIPEKYGITRTTRTGKDLAWALNPALGTTPAINRTCSEITRLAATHHRLSEYQCNGDPMRSQPPFTRERDEEAARRESAIDARVERLEARIADVVSGLPHTDEGPIRVMFQGDPRGCTVKLVMPGSLVRLHDDWGQEGICARR